MKERPILMSAPMVRAILDGSKTQTRRVMKPQPQMVAEKTTKPWRGDAAVLMKLMSDIGRTCTYGQPGDRLWVREAWAGCWGPLLPGFGKLVTDVEVKQRDGNIAFATETDPLQVFYSADHAYRVLPHLAWKPSIHMPRWASRIDLEITGVRGQQLQDISDEDAIAEGIGLNAGAVGVPTTTPAGETIPRAMYRGLWESINGPGSWDANPWVWAVDFRRA